MVDIHCHLLPGLDDGSDDLEMSLKMAETAIADGITHVIATPHADAAYRFVPEDIRAKREELERHLHGRLILATGCDFHMSFENVEDLRADVTKYTLNQKNYLLVEFNDYSIPPSMDQTLHLIQLFGATPIITHPERNPLIRSKLGRLYKWVRQGCYVQVTAQSLLGRFGPAAQKCAESLLENDAIHFFASDAHNVSSRPLQLKDAFEKVREKRGEEIAQALFTDNPLAAFEGRPLPYVPGLAEDQIELDESGGKKKKKRFWFF
jgi:protein-tyrosine phosphatase